MGGDGLSITELFKNNFKTVKWIFPYILRLGSKYEPAVEEYPDAISSRDHAKIYPRAKGLLSNNINVCTGCGDCIELCPTKALDLETDINSSGNVTIDKFVIDHGRCISCSYCIEFCPVKSLSYTGKFEMSTVSSLELLEECTEKAKMEKVKSVKEKVKQIRSYEIRR